MPISDLLINSLPVAGTVLGGPIGGAIGTLGAGILGQASANQKQKAYNKAENAIPLYDPMQQGFLARVRQQERNLRAGTDPSSAMAQRLAGNLGAQTQSNLIRAGGPGAVSNLLRSQQALGNQVAQIGANAATGANQLLSYQGGLIDNMANRVYQRQRELRNQALARYEQGRQDANNNMMAAIGLLPQMEEGGIFSQEARNRREMNRIRNSRTPTSYVQPNPIRFQAPPLPTPTPLY